MQYKKTFTIKIGGQAGQGIRSSGLMVSKFAVRSGYYIYSDTEFPSIIRGGHNVMQINISDQEVIAPSLKTDLLICLNQDTLNKHVHELSSDSGILFDADGRIEFSKLDKRIEQFPIPLLKLAKSTGGGDLLINTVALGAVVGLLGGDIKILKDIILEEYAEKGQEILDSNTKAADLGYEYVQKNFSEFIKKVLDPVGSIIPNIIINGTEAVAFGAIAAGMQFAAIYPMSPISNILHVLAANQEKYGYVYKQPEDEISAINMAIGASFAGARSMTATSGGGFCLMTESYGLAGMTETPLVIIEGMRGGPATGLPTWSEQGDLKFVLGAHQGEFPKIVLAAGDAQEAFELTMKAFNLADKYQTPVVVLIDKNICECDQSFRSFDFSKYKIERGKYTIEKIPDYKRYVFESDGVSTRTIPGTGNFFVANSDEHDEFGYSTEEIEERNLQMKKRMQKLLTCEKEDMSPPILFGPESADITVVSWGSNKGSILEALKNFDNVNFLYITWLSPFPSEKALEILSKASKIVGIECNYSGQLAELIREKTGIEIKDKLLKYDGRPMYPEEIKKFLEGIS